MACVPTEAAVWTRSRIQAVNAERGEGGAKGNPRRRNALEDIVNEGVEDDHGLVRYTGIDKPDG